MPKKALKEIKDNKFEPIMIGDADFVPAPAEGSKVDPGEVREVLRAEIEEDGQLASYELIQLGGEMDPTGKSAKGKIYADLRNGSDDKVDPRTEMRFVSRPKNGNERVPLTEWMPLRDLDHDDPRKRMPLRPSTDGDGDPLLVKSGRYLALEVRNGATEFEVDQGNSDFTVPAIAGY